MTDDEMHVEKYLGVTLTIPRSLIERLHGEGIDVLAEIKAGIDNSLTEEDRQLLLELERNKDEQE